MEILKFETQEWWTDANGNSVPPKEIKREFINEDGLLCFETVDGEIFKAQ